MKARSRRFLSLIEPVRRKAEPEPGIADLRLVKTRHGVVRVSVDGRPVDLAEVSGTPLGNALIELAHQWGRA